MHCEKDQRYYIGLSKDLINPRSQLVKIINLLPNIELTTFCLEVNLNLSVFIILIILL